MGTGKTIQAVTRGLILPVMMVGWSGPCQSAPYTFGAAVVSACSIAGKNATVTFGALTDANGNYTASGAQRDAPDDAASCNQGQTTAKVQRTNFTTSGAIATGFVNAIPMAAVLTTTQGSILSDTSTDPGTGTSAGISAQINAFTGLKVTATLGSITSRLVSGTYTGTITVTLTPTS